MNTKTVGFLGLGLMGGSIAKAIRINYPEYRIISYTRTAETSEYALRERIIDEICLSPTDPKFSECDYLFFCAPVTTNTKLLSMMKDIISPNCLITDIGSVKTGIHKEIQRLGLTKQFVGGHPMTGSEKNGVAYAKAELFENAYYILTPERDVPIEMVIEYRDLVKDMGAIPMILTYEEHDYITATVSHVPHLIAAALVNTVHDLDSEKQHMKTIAAGGFKDITRIASSSPEMWEQICMSNRENIVKVLDDYIDMLQGIRKEVAEGNGAAIHHMFEDSREYRSGFDSSVRGPISQIFYCNVSISDEAGAIAVIATLLAFRGINIKNIGIAHNREYDEGVLRIDFYDAQAMRKAIEVLREHNYEVHEKK